jgi:DNA replication protein DnaC
MNAIPAIPANHPAHALDAYRVIPKGEMAVAEALARPNCPMCNGSGHARSEIEGVITMGRCRCQMLADRVHLFNLACIPARYVSATFISFAQTPDGQFKELHPSAIRALGYASQWVADFNPAEANRGMVLHGEVGRGKTHLLIATIRDLIFTHGVPARFIEFSRLLSSLKAGYSEGRSDAPLLTELAEIPVLAIDELGKGRLSDWELTIIDEVISRRYNGMGCTLATSNYAPGEPSGAAPPNLATVTQSSQTLGDRVGDRVHSRLLQLVDFVELAGQDHRNSG